MDTASLNRLKDVHPDIMLIVSRAYNRLIREGITIRVVQGLRTLTEQDALYAQGRTKPGKVVTNAKGGQSNHNYGLAVDIVPGVKGSGPWKPQWDVKSPEFQRMVDVLKDEGFLWGGDWKNMKGDYDHFYLPKAPANPNAEMQADLRLGGVPRVYKNYDEEKYV